MSAPTVGDDENILLGAARAGDAEAFRRLWAPVERRAFGLCLHLTDNRADALDALQETQIAVWRNLGRFEGRAPFAAWVMVIARNSARSVARRVRAAREDLLFPEVEPVDVESGFDETVAGLVDLRRALATLPASHKEALLLWAGGLTYEQTAAALQVPLNTVRVWIFRARKALRETLGRP
ncbi:sigma-70 family RNA polymerase sigma factor [Planotetraspora phitsanulokensis]|uniref:DNA-directed RNA polymerase sigma-70 factor n=1 Tax=Planotetraspora phitsanulokensis TaxID=575192 RepID=A0A8J3XF73_9ACTN|nr:RNA polymerase sigma factor [Planotetraspora phitsanulokensis]GII39322.1 DNA-directed RNA polymerase sigma-70 factor [Planotetraspora phitsanulokensis]